LKVSTYQIDDMCCPTEEQILRNRLRKVQGIEGLEFDLINRKLTVEHQLDDPRSIEQAIQSVGMTPQVVHEDAEGDHEDHEHNHSSSVLDRWLLGASGVLAVAAEIVGWVSGAEHSWPVITLALLSIALGGRETIRKGIASVRTFTLNINFLMSLAIIGAMVIGSWPEAAMVTFLFGLAEMIEAASLDRARNAIKSLLQLKPESATVKSASGEWEEVAASSVAVGQLVRVKPGERIALDGRVVSGASTVNQAPITGESMPVEKGTGDQVFAGTINERGSFEFETTTTGGNTTLSRIITAVQQAQAQRAPTQRFIDNFARYYTPTVVTLAVLVAAAPPLLFGQPFQPWLYKALVLLVIACPCALVISTPVTVVSGLATAARRGILIKGGVHLENGRRLKLIALDKTGTLTQGAPKVTDVIPLVDRSPQELHQIAASVDALSEHPVASAIVSGWTGADRSRAGSESPDRLDAAAKGHELRPVTAFEAITGRGVKGIVNGVLYYVGNHRLVHELDVCGPHVEEKLEALEAEAKTVVVLMTERESLAVIAVADTLRETSIEAIHDLRTLGVATVMLTGDNSLTAKAIAEKLGIGDARGDLLPEDKLAAIDDLVKSHGAVGMVGDGINDAPALARATIGFAMGAAGTDTALETADVALMQDDLRKLPEFIQLSRRTATVLAQNITIAIVIKVVFFALALAGIATLWMAVFADLGGSLLVVANGLRLLRPKPDLSTRTSVRKP
jgi:Cd2+/Zn2+-exporting ATPase